MKSSIYVSAEKIHIIGFAENTFTHYASCQLPEGTMYNGTIIEPAYLVECLISLKQNNPELFKSGVTLIVDGSSILSRRLNTPMLSRKRYLQMIRDDFADSIENPEDIVCGYRKLDMTGNSIFACATHRVLVDSYLSVFKQAGISPDSIHIGAEAILSYVKSNPELQRSTIVLNVIDGVTMLSLIFEDGNNVFMSRSRLYGEDNDEFLRSVLNNLNGLIQFNRSQNFGEIERSYYMGLSEGDMAQINALNPHSNIQMKPLILYNGKDAPPHNAHFACLNTMLGNESIDLITALKELGDYIKGKKPRRIWLPLIAAFAAVLAIPVVYLLLELNSVKNDVEEVFSYVYSGEVMRKKDELAALAEELAFYEDITYQFERNSAWENSLPQISSQALDEIIFLHGKDISVTSIDFDESTGIIRVYAKCANANTPTEYVDALTASGIASSIEYHGYDSDPEGLFTFYVDIYL